MLIEDCRSAIGAVAGTRARQVGTIGSSGCFSFADGRQLPMGEGGMVVTADEDLAERVRLLRSHAMTTGTWDRHRGHADTYDVVDVGFNYRLDEPRAALGLSRLARLSENLEARRAVARELPTALAGVPGVRPCYSLEDDATSAHGAFAVLPRTATARWRRCGRPAYGRDATGAGGAPRASDPAARLVVLAPEPGLDVAAVAAALAG